jgi:hypothetical protein
VPFKKRIIDPSVRTPVPRVDIRQSGFVLKRSHSDTRGKTRDTPSNKRENRRYSSPRQVISSERLSDWYVIIRGDLGRSNRPPALNFTAEFS